MTQTPLKKKIALAIVTRNNHVLLQHFIDSINRYDAGYPYDLFILDNSSDDEQHLALLDKLVKKYTVLKFQNDRVEATYARFQEDYIRQSYNYRGVLFCHDDSCVIRNDWIKVYIDRLESNYKEPEIAGLTVENAPIGRIGACHQFWRSMTSVKGFNIRCEFLDPVLKMLNGASVNFFKYSDPERIFFTHECLHAGKMITLKHFSEMPEHERLKYEISLNNSLPYLDEGIAPKDKYPRGFAWNKLTMTTEFLNSIQPLVYGFRTTGLEGDGFLEQIDGFDELWGQNYIMHWGSANMKRFLSKKFNVSTEEIHKMLYSKNRIHLFNFEKIAKAEIVK